MRYLFSLLIAGILTGCPGGTNGDSIPLDRLYYPSALAKNGNLLYVANANLDRQYQDGSVLEVDVTTAKITRGWSISSLPGQFALSSDASDLWLPSQGQPILNNILAGNKSFSLTQQEPYFVTLIPGTSAGFLGYLYRTDNILSNEFSLIKDLSELQYFEKSEIKQSLRLANCLKDSTQRLRISCLGGIQVSTDNKTVFAVAEIVVNPDSQRQKHVFLIQAPVTDLSQCSATDVSQTLNENAQGARGITISGNTAYLLLDENPALVSLSLSGPKLNKSISTCKAPGNLKMTPDGKTLFVLCPRTNQVIAYDAAGLSVIGEVQTALDMKRDGLSPVDMVIDGQQLWVSYQNSHQIGILTYANTDSGRFLRFDRWFELSR